MANKTWTVTRIKHPKYPRLTVRVGEYVPGGTIHVFWWERGKQRSRSLGVRRADLGAGRTAQEREARRLGGEVIETLAKRSDDARTPRTPLTLQRLYDHYATDGLLRASPAYRRDALSCVRRVVEAFGPDVLVMEVRPSFLDRYVARRKQEGHAPAGRRDLVALSLACNWAVGEGLVDENPLSAKRALSAMRIAHEPARPYRTKAEFEALRAVAPKVGAPAFATILDLAWHTGHRISAILGLRWEHVALDASERAPYGAVTWYAGAAPDRKKREHTLPLNAEAHAALTTWRRQGRRLPVGFLFPSPVDPTKRIDTSVPKKWLRRAEVLAGLPHQKQGGWHAFRRGWATARKHLPIQDVMKAGGWTDTATILRSYQHATPDDTRAAATFVA